jgi:fucose permease
MAFNSDMANLPEIKRPQNRPLPLNQIGLCFGLFTLVGLTNGASGVLLPDISRYYRVDNSIIGLLYVGENVGYALAAFYSGNLVAKFGLRWFIVAGLIIFALSSFTVGMALPLLSVLIGRTVMGSAMAIMEGGPNFFFSSLPRHTTLLNYLHSFFGAGSLLGPLVATFVLASGMGWNVVYLGWLLVSLPLLVGSTLWFTPQERVTPGESKAAETNIVHDNSNKGLMRATLSLRAVWLGAIFLMLYVGIEIGTGAWVYTYLTTRQGFEPIFCGWAVSGYWLGITLGRLILARLAEGLGVSGKGLIHYTLVLAAIGGAIIWWGNGEVVSALGLGLVGLGLGPVYPTILAVMPEVVAPRLVPSAIGFVTSLSILGAAIFPSIAGFIFDGLGLGWFVPFFAGLGVVTASVWILFVRQHRQDRYS